jgi:choline kinase
MKVIILAAGQGKRLKPLTDNRPKCMVEIFSRPLLHFQLDSLNAAGIPRKDVAIIGGYLQNKIVAPGVKKFSNPEYDKTNMVATLFCAQEWMKPGENLLICYSDIVYSPEIVKAVIKNDGEVSLAADKNWKKLWSIRMENPLEDAETFKISNNGKLTEVGKNPNSYDDIEAQYIGITKIRGDKVKDFIDFYEQLDQSQLYDGKNFANMYMTSLIQQLIDAKWDVCPAIVNGGWFEVDSVEDIEVYQKSFIVDKTNGFPVMKNGYEI